MVANGPHRSPRGQFWRSKRNNWNVCLSLLEGHGIWGVAAQCVILRNTPVQRTCNKFDMRKMKQTKFRIRKSSWAWADWNKTKTGNRPIPTYISYLNLHAKLPSSKRHGHWPLTIVQTDRHQRRYSENSVGRGGSPKLPLNHILRCRRDVQTYDYVYKYKREAGLSNMCICFVAWLDILYALLAVAPDIQYLQVCLAYKNEKFQASKHH